MREERARYGKRSVLEMTAQQMREFAAAHPWKPGMRIAAYRRRIAEGLSAEFYWDTRTGDFTLALVREDRYPDDAECARARYAFGAPILLTQARPPYIVEGMHVCKFVWKVRHARECGDGSAQERVSEEERDERRDRPRAESMGLY